jgi:hypothetical protein
MNGEKERIRKEAIMVCIVPNRPDMSICIPSQTRGKRNSLLLN